MEWIKRIREAERVGHFTYGDMLAAGSWDTCVVGEMLGDAHHPDTQVYNAGIEFDYNVNENDIPAALYTYKLILRLTRR